MAGNVDDLEVFRRAYALSLELHRASLGGRMSSNMAVSQVSCGDPPNRCAPS